MLKADAVKIIAGSTVIAICLGIAIDMVTAHVAVEYFSVHHPQYIGVQPAWVLALYWGVAASWWFGLVAGGTLALINARQPNPLPWSQVLKLIAFYCLAIWVTMMLIVLGIYLFAGRIPMDVRRPSFESDRRLMAVAIAHLSEYVLGAIAVIGIGVTIRRAGSR